MDRNVDAASSLSLGSDNLASIFQYNFQFDGQLYEQREGVAMGSPLGPLLANVFMCHLEEELSDNGLIGLTNADT